MSNKKTLMEKYGQFGFQPDMEGFVNLFRANTPIKEICIKVESNDDTILEDYRNNVIAEYEAYPNGDERFCLQYFDGYNLLLPLMDISVGSVTECISKKYSKSAITYRFAYGNIYYCFEITLYSKNFSVEKLKKGQRSNTTGKEVTSLSTQDLLKMFCGGYWSENDYTEMNQRNFYDLFSVDGTFVSNVQIWVNDCYMDDKNIIHENAMLFKNTIRNACLRHEINEDGDENIVIHKGKVKGDNGYDSNFVVSIPCEYISGCICRERKEDGIKEIQFAFGNVIYYLKIKIAEVK